MTPYSFRTVAPEDNDDGAGAEALLLLASIEMLRTSEERASTIVSAKER